MIKTDNAIIRALSETLQEVRALEVVTGHRISADALLLIFARKLAAMPDDAPEQERDGETGDAPGA